MIGIYQISKILDKGFKGIYIDVTAYDDASLKELTLAIENVLGTKPLISDNMKKVIEDKII